MTDRQIVEAVLALLPPDRAMASLTPSGPRPEAEAAGPLIERAASAHVRAGLWLWLDDLERSHQESQKLNDAAGSLWHGLMHRREGDLSNAEYWLRRAPGHEAWAKMGEHDPVRFSQTAALEPESAHSVSVLRQEWQELMAWCLDRSEEQ
jgi:hypothetical protein